MARYPREDPGNRTATSHLCMLRSSNSSNRKGSSNTKTNISKKTLADDKFSKPIDGFNRRKEAMCLMQQPLYPLPSTMSQRRSRQPNSNQSPVSPRSNNSSNRKSSSNRSSNYCHNSNSRVSNNCPDKRSSQKQNNNWKRGVMVQLQKLDLYIDMDKMVAPRSS